MAATTCIWFGVITDVITGLWVYLGRELPFKTLSYAMFFPTIIAFLFVDNIFDFVIRVSGVEQIGVSLLYGFLAGPISVGIVGICATAVVFLGWGVRTNFKQEGHNNVFAPAFMRAAGEEIGWRCFMLPCLMSYYSPGVALLISGIIWGFFHVPVLILLTGKMQPPKPYITVLVQCIACVLSAFPHGWIAIKSGYSLWASTMMHAAWNRFNPAVLGSIYTQQPGYIEGDQWLINGEGLIGCIVMLPVAAFTLWDLSSY
ncbi:uncharacterized protein LOC126829292 [Patella vulgata]|uniref:uncharacterized protein LOC126829292 n=1 Tax=Patella vulgata TaxID=6465 RepID=UPI0024A7E205|nr:uncharacterized protein LOC126829292 [Patella vulgata]